MTKTYCDICGDEVIYDGTIQSIDVFLEINRCGNHKNILHVDFCQKCREESRMLSDLYYGFEDDFQNDFKKKIINIIKEKLKCL